MLSGNVTRQSVGLAGLTDSIFDYGKPAMFFTVYAALIVHLSTESCGRGSGRRRPRPQNGTRTLP